MAAVDRVGVIVFAAFEAVYLIPTMALVGTLLVGAVVVALVRHWQRSSRIVGKSTSDQLAEFRTLYEKGAISEEEYHRLRDVLRGELRQKANLPAKPTQGIKPATQPPPSDAPTANPPQPPTDGVQPA